MRSSFIATLVLGLAAVACSESVDETETSSDAIIGGVDASSAKLDAVGAMVAIDANGEAGAFCTATLIAPDLVITPKQCVAQKNASGVLETFLSKQKVVFRIGSKLASPKRDVPAKELYQCELNQGGMSGSGCDVAVYRLAEAVTDVTPIPVASTSVPKTLIGRDAAILGYGSVSALDTVGGYRLMATQTIRATEGQEMATLFTTLEQFRTEIAKTEGVEFVNTNKDAIAARYAYRLLPDYEVAVGGRPGNGDLCTGDTGSPLLVRENGKLVVYGMSISSLKGGKSLCLAMGGIFSSFGPDAQKLFRRATSNDPCIDMPESGRCEGEVAARCSRPDEGGPRRIVSTDCGALGLGCGMGANGAMCR
jgi:secreted trypsin-like serine protease